MVSGDMAEHRMDKTLEAQILKILAEHRIMTLATLRPDGWPQATTVGYVSLGLTLYFLCALDSQKAANLARDGRVSVTIDHDTSDLMAITGLSMAARAERVTDPAEGARILALMPLKYPEETTLPMPMPEPDQVAIFRLTPTVISVLDYTKGFGHSELVTL
jgi:nitroimidazol reductase NimA-like FMN-containing flavoprotein (pyridoxamine 5'-phosphate oxidase superfamily)